MTSSNCLVTSILQNIVCVQQKKATYTGLQQQEGEQMATKFFFSGLSVHFRQRDTKRNIFCLALPIKKKLREDAF